LVMLMPNSSSKLKICIFCFKISLMYKRGLKWHFNVVNVSVFLCMVCASAMV
jgi:hypothetical protein